MTSTSRTILLTSLLWIIVGLSYTYFAEYNLVKNYSTSIYQTITGSHHTNMDNNDRWTQPYWAYKYDFMEQPDDIKPEHRICFVHVGKTAGSTLACYMGFNYGQCSTGENETSSLFFETNYKKKNKNLTAVVQKMIPDGKLAHYTTSMIHRQFDSCIEAGSMDVYLFVVRNPLSRIQSWFEYERPLKNENNTTQLYMQKKPLFVDCKFTSLNELGGPRGLGNNNATLCSRRAFRAIAGTIGYTAHNKYNYGYYYQKVKQSTDDGRFPQRIAVIRTEHIKDDWSSIEVRMLGGQPLPSNFEFTKKNKSPKLVEDMILSDESRENICAVLCHEIQVYKRILQRAENLNKADYAQSFHELSQSCPKQALQESC